MFEMVEGFERKLFETIPEEAFREALANVFHRLLDHEPCVEIRELTRTTPLPVQGISRL